MLSLVWPGLTRFADTEKCTGPANIQTTFPGQLHLRSPGVPASVDQIDQHIYLQQHGMFYCQQVYHLFALKDILYRRHQVIHLPK